MAAMLCPARPPPSRPFPSSPPLPSLPTAAGSFPACAPARQRRPSPLSQARTGRSAPTAHWLYPARPGCGPPDRPARPDPTRPHGLRAEAGEAAGDAASGSGGARAFRGRHRLTPTRGPVTSGGLAASEPPQRDPEPSGALQPLRPCQPLLTRAVNLGRCLQRGQRTLGQAAEGCPTPSQQPCWCGALQHTLRSCPELFSSPQVFEGCFIQQLYPKASFWHVPRTSRAFNHILLMPF